MHVAIIGDSHGNIPFLEHALAALARQRDVGVITDVVAISVGDFGWWPVTPWFVDACLELVERYQIPLWALDGNHDYPGDGVDRSGYLTWSETDPDPAVHRFAHLPRGTTFELDGVRFGVLGGAVSIDRQMRVTGRSWWPAEAISDADVEAIAASPATVDIMISHDAPALPAGFTEYISLADPALHGDLLNSQRQVRRVLDIWQPRLVVHGHFHHRYDAELPVGWSDRPVHIRGLADEALDRGVYVIDLASNVGGASTRP